MRIGPRAVVGEVVVLAAVGGGVGCLASGVVGVVLIAVGVGVVIASVEISYARMGVFVVLAVAGGVVIMTASRVPVLTREAPALVASVSGCIGASVVRRIVSIVNVMVVVSIVNVMNVVMIVVLVVTAVPVVSIMMPRMLDGRVSIVLVVEVASDAV